MVMDMAGGPSTSASVDFFVSYSPADERWAVWIAWVLEEAGFRTMVQAWDFIPGGEFIDYMDRGVKQAAAIIAVLSPNYLNSRYGRMEWQAALRSSPDDPGRRLIPVRVAECELDGLLATITYLDLLGIADENAARKVLLARVGEALAGRGGPSSAPAFPADGADPARLTMKGIDDTPPAHGLALENSPLSRGGMAARGRPMTAPTYPLIDQTSRPRESITLLHLPGPRFGRGLVNQDSPDGPEQWQARIGTWLTLATGLGAPEPDVLLISGDLTESGAPSQADAVQVFLAGLRSRLGLESARVALVPGPHDISAAACRAYFADCEAEERAPLAPYWPKWRLYSRLFQNFYQGMDVIFDADQPWTMFEVPELRLVIAGFNSTIALSHRRDDEYGLIGDVQAAYFAGRLRAFEKEGWLRVGLVAHPVPTRQERSVQPGLLRDSDVFTRLLGSVNLVVHGEGTDQRHRSVLGWLSNRVPLVPPADPGAPQLLVLTATGLTRWTTGHSGRPVPTDHPVDWQATHATFRPLRPPPEPTEVAAAPERAEADRSAPSGPVSELLDRISEVCDVRFERAKVRRTDDGAAHLRVTYAQDGIVHTLLIGALAEPDPAAQLDRFLRHVHASAPSDPAEVVHDLGAGPHVEPLRASAAAAGVRLRSFAEFQGLLDLGDFLAVQSERLHHSAYDAGHYVTQRYRSMVGEDLEVRSDLVGELQRLVSEDDGRFVLLLGDFGRGKTFALRELTRRLTATPRAPTPILIDLRALDRAHTVDGLVAAHLANFGNTLIDLRAFRYLLRQGRIVLIFDGFDELVSRVSYEQAADHLEMLVQAAQDNAKIIVASRTQHFRSREHVLTALGERVGLLPQRRLLNLQEFERGQILDFLARWYGNQAAAETRYALFEQISNLSSLAANPRLLAFLAQIDAERLTTLVRGGTTLSAARLYQEMIEYWLDFESRRTARPGAAPGLTPEELMDAVTRLAVRLWQRAEVCLRPGDIAEVAEALAELATPMTGPETEHALGSGSLLTRDDDGLFGFIHFSVCEWLVARHITDRLAENDRSLLEQRKLSALAADFLCSLAPAEALDAWVRATVEGNGRLADLGPHLENALLVSSRLNLEVIGDLSGADLSGQDLSFRDLRQVNLSRANLTGARLIKTKLAGADMHGANLSGALLAKADLTGADLTGATLTRARFMGAELGDVRWAGAHADLAAFVGVKPRQARDELRRLGAAVAPPMPVSFGLAPADVGMPHGFEVGRIPDPVSYHPRGTTLVFGSADGALLVCDASTGQPVRSVQGHRDRVYAVRHSPDGKLLLTGSADGTARIWDAETFDELHVLRDHEGWVWPVELAPSGLVAASGDATGDVRIWDTASGECVARLATRQSRIWAAAFNPALQGIATGEQDGTVRIWHVRTGKSVFEFHTDSGAAYRVRYSPDGNYLASAHHDGNVYEYTVGKGLSGSPQLLAGTGYPVYGLRYHPDGARIVSGDTGGTVALWTLTPTAPGAPPDQRVWNRHVWTKHSGAVYGLNISIDGMHMASSDNYGTVRLGDPVAGATPRELKGHTSSVWPMAFRTDGAMVATSSQDRTLRVWDTRSGAAVNLLRGHSRQLWRARFDSTGTRVATSGSDGIVRVWDARTGRLLARPSITDGRLVAAFYSPDGSVLAAWDNTGVVHMWNARSGEYERQIVTDSIHLWTGKFSPDGEVLATAEDDEVVRLRYRTTGRLIGELKGHTKRVRSIAFSDDGRWLATGSDDQTVRIWDRERGDLCILTLCGHTDRVSSVTFDYRSTTLATASNDGTALIWDLSDLAEVTEATPPQNPAGHSDTPGTGTIPVRDTPRSRLERGTGGLWRVAFSPDGTMLATASDDLAVRLWDARSGDHISTLLGHTRRVCSVEFSPFGNTLVSSGDDGTAMVWDLAPLARRERPAVRMTLVGVADGWVAATPDGRYKADGDVEADVWHVIGNCRFPLDGLGEYLPHVRRVSLDAELTTPEAKAEP